MLLNLKLTRGRDSRRKKIHSLSISYLSTHVFNKAAHRKRGPVGSAHKQALQNYTIEWGFCSSDQKSVQLLV